MHLYITICKWGWGKSLSLEAELSDCASNIYSPFQNSSKQFSSCPQQVWHIAFLSLFNWQTNLIAKQWSTQSSRAAHSPGTTEFSLSAHAESLSKFVPVIAHLMEKALKQHLGNSCLKLRTPVHLSFGFILKCLQWIICFLHLKQDTAGTSRIRVQAGEDPGFSHSPARI